MPYKPIGERINVFISSICGETKYDVVRAALSDKIESTSLASVYTFENSPGSTLPAEQEFLRAIDNCDVCIFLIDNKDGVRDGVLKEIQRAKDHGKKSFFIFCDENQSEPTQVQKELRGGNNVHYKVVHSFTDFMFKGFDGIIADIGKIYLGYCRGYLIDNEMEKNENSQLLETHTGTELPKGLLVPLDRAQAYLIRKILGHQKDCIATSSMDDFCLDFLQIIWGDKSIQDFNIPMLLEELKKVQNTHTHEVVILRWQAIQYYYQDNLENSVARLEAALSIAKARALPRWLIQDILIDLKNTITRINRRKNIIYSEIPAQVELQNDTEALFYPLIDRIEKELYEALYDDEIEKRFESPYTITIGHSYGKFFSNIAMLVNIGLYFGSITKLRAVSEHIESIMHFLCNQHDDWTLQITLFKFILILESGSTIRKVVATLNKTIGKMNAEDAASIYLFISNLPWYDQQFTAKLHAFEILGSYFSDEDFKQISHGIIQEIQQWLNHEDRIISFYESIFVSLRANIRRMNSDTILQICNRVFELNLRRFYDDVFKLLAAVDYCMVGEETLARFLDHIRALVVEDDLRINIQGMERVLIVLQKKVPFQSIDLVPIIQEKMPQFYESEFKLETSSLTPEEIEFFLGKNISMIHSDNETQGKNGTYSVSFNRPFIEILYILDNYFPSLLSEKLSDLANAISETLLVKRQMVDAKIDAIKLALFLTRKYTQFRNIFILQYSLLLDDAESIETGFNGGLGLASTSTLSFWLLLLHISYKTMTYQDLYAYLATYQNEHVRELIFAFDAIELYTSGDIKDHIDEPLMFALMQFALTGTDHHDKDVRKNAVNILINLYSQPIASIILNRLSLIMDSDNAGIKITILRRLQSLERYSYTDVFSLIMQKASIDNHYLVREEAKRLSQEN